MKVSESKDLDLDFELHPVTGDINVLTGMNAVKRSIRNLIMLNTLEKPFHPEIGANLRSKLFENFASPFVRRDVKDIIAYTINNYEPRAALKNVLVNAKYDNNSLEVKIEFQIKGDSVATVGVLPLTLERLR
tara:strand:- start:207 stop:602 length:396 start_codon:yes stop_codon:yes gene_type:complete